MKIRDSILDTRINNIRSFLSEKQAIITTNSNDLLYICNSSFSKGWLYIDKQNVILGIDSRYKYNSKSIIVQEYNSSVDFEKNVFVSFGSEYSEIWSLKKSFKCLKGWKPSEIFFKSRMIKDDCEKEAIMEAADICKTVLKRVINKIKNNRNSLTEKDLSRFIKKCIFEEGGDGIAFEPIVAFGENSSIPHHCSSDRRYQKREVILFDFGVQKNGYCVDVARTLAYDRKSKIIKDLAVRAKEKSEELVKNGANFKNIREKIAKFFKDNLEIKQERVHDLGHGIGIDVHECPRFSNDKITNSSVFSLEPGVYVENCFGAREEDTYMFVNDTLINITEI